MAEELKKPEGAPPAPAAAAEVPPEPTALFYVLSFVIPLAGIILGAIYLSKPDAANKKFGKMCLTLALTCIGVIIVAYCCFFGAYLSFIIAYLIIILIVVVAAAAGSTATTNLPLPPFHHR